MTIDAKELREAIAAFPCPVGPLAIVLKAASAYAATLPREVEIEAWGVLYGNGAFSCLTYESEAEASMHASNAVTPGSVVVRLTGKATLPPRDKD